MVITNVTSEFFLFLVICSSLIILYATLRFYQKFPLETLCSDYQLYIFLFLCNQLLHWDPILLDFDPIHYVFTFETNNSANSFLFQYWIKFFTTLEYVLDVFIHLSNGLYFSSHWREFQCIPIPSGQPVKILQFNRYYVIDRPQGMYFC